ncbi:MAG: alpha/beta hydrolase [Silicimonas sp.]|nr:alpha/beta hydrolase [Silicimonas sp.]
MSPAITGGAMRYGRVLLLVAGVLFLVGATWIVATFRSDMAAARAHLAAYRPRVIETTAVPVETVDMGDGFPVLSIHGTGGGYDQGEDIAAPLLYSGYRVIAPSRFGYLGAEVPDQTDAAAQADLFAALLDSLGVERAVVMGTSAGAVTALHFAARHPDRTAALLAIVPAYFPSENAAEPPWSPIGTWAVTRALRSDALFWAGLKLAPDRLASAILATDPAILENADPAERARLHAIVWNILPISARVDGLLLDARNTADPVPVDLSRITAPTLAISAEDDRYGTAASARLIAGRIDGAKLLVTPDGGHAWAGREDEVWAVVRNFLAHTLAAETAWQRP